MPVKELIFLNTKYEDGVLRCLSRKKCVVPDGIRLRHYLHNFSDLRQARFDKKNFRMKSVLTVSKVCYLKCDVW
jgi:hypothetical protein